MAKIVERKRRVRCSPPVIKFCESPCDVAGLIGSCHVYQGGKFNGYGRVWDGKRNALVHKYVYERVNGPVQSGMVLDHMCRNRACCNIDHLRVVTRKVNSTENIQGHPWQLGRAMTHCKRGHEFNSENTRIRDSGSRVCKVCEKQNRINRMTLINA